MIELLLMMKVVVAGGVGKLLLLLLISGVAFNFRIYHEQLWRDGRGKDRIIFHENGIQWGPRVAKRRVMERIQDTRINFFTGKVQLQHATIIIIIIEMVIIIIHIGAWSTNGSGRDSENSRKQQ